jgi:hypothetical protein
LELFKWINGLSAQQLSSTEVQLVNLIVDNLEKLTPLGTSGGLRSKKIVQVYQENEHQLSNTLPVPPTVQAYGNVGFGRISRLEIGPFRGFSEPQVFDFEKKSAFLFGPNGSGKSSFFEGLEYALLGEVSEASAKRFAPNEYARNSTKLKFVVPRVIFTDSTGVDRVFETNPSRYKFAFVEKNRIDSFARIPAATPSEQRDRIAILFGLDAFNEFVNGFSDSLESYVLLEAKKASEFLIEERDQVRRIARLAELEEILTENSRSLDSLISEFGDSKITTREQLMDLLVGKDRISGLIKELEGQRAVGVPDDYSTVDLLSLTHKANGVLSSLVGLQEMHDELESLARDVSYKSLFEAVTALGAENSHIHTTCPACDTPLAVVVSNPFQKAQSELRRLEGLTTLQENLVSTENDIAAQVRLLNTCIKAANEEIQRAEIAKPIPVVHEILEGENHKSLKWMPSLYADLDTLLSLSEHLESVAAAMVEKNRELSLLRDKHSGIDGALARCRRFEGELMRFEEARKYLEREKIANETAIETFIASNKSRLDEIEQERLLIARNKVLVDGYRKVVHDLKSYRDGLPASLSAGLSERVKEFYNIVNSQDSQYEQLEWLKLPASPGEKILVCFKGNMVPEDAIHVLSEGHLKILGLTILIAKAVNENVGFIAFDDIVNAIDDDHKSGVADLLVDHPTLTAKQLIITCHGQNFIGKLETKLGSSRVAAEVKNFKFLPGDVLSTRGVTVASSNPNHYLLRAKIAYNTNNLKEAAGLCRQATEAQTTILWKKLSRKLNVTLSVGMRVPGAIPELNSVVEGLIREFKKLGPETEICLSLIELKADYNWSLMNKGIHEQDGLPEFERADVGRLIALLEKLDALIGTFQISASAVSAEGATP